MSTTRTVVRITGKEWLIWEGLVPLPGTELRFGYTRRIDPSVFFQMLAYKDPEKEDSWKGSYNQAVTYTLFGRKRTGSPTMLLRDVRKENADYLKRVLEDRLRTGARAEHQPADRDAPMHLAEAGTGVDEAQMEGRPPFVAPPRRSRPWILAVTAALSDRETCKVERALGCLACRQCGGTIPPDSALCGQCGATLELEGL